MKRIKFLLANVGLLVAMAVPFVSVGSAQAAEVNLVDRCQSDLAVTKQVKVPGGAFVDAPDSASAPSVHVGDTVDWLISVENQSTGCEGMPELPGQIILHDALPTGVTYVSSLAGAGSYDATTNDWTFTNMSFNLHPTIQLQLTTTANQTGTFENVATLSQLKLCADANDDCKATTIDYAIGLDDQYAFSKDVDPSNDSANAWVNVSGTPGVLAASTTSGAPDTGFGSPTKNSKALMLIEVGLLGLGVAGLLVRKRASSK